MGRRDEAIAIIEDARQSHIEWADFMALNPESQRVRAAVPEIGGADYHREWVEKYDLVLAELRSN